jgi:hypothetical protein
MAYEWRTELDGTRHTLFRKAERWWWVALALVSAGVIASLLVISPSDQTRTVRMALWALVSTSAPVLAAFAKFWSSQLASRGDRCRRAALYKDSLGESLPSADRQLLALWPRHIPLEKATTSEPYYAASEPQGCVRLALNIAESAFHSRYLARIVAVSGFILSAGVLIATLLAASTTSYLPFDPRAFDSMQSGVSAIATVILVLLLGEIALTSLSYWNLSSDCDEVFKAGSQLAAASDCTLPRVLRISEEYSIALAVNLPLPNFLYKLLRSRIEMAYKQVGAVTP